MDRPATPRREFRLLWSGSVLATFGGQMSSLAVPLLVLRQTGSAVQAGAVGTVSVIVLLVSMLPGGAMADGLERRRLMRLTDLVSLISIGLLALAVLNSHTPYLLILAVAATSALLTSVSSPAAAGLLREVVPNEQYGAAASRLQAGGSAARMAGPLVGGALFGVSPAAPLLCEFACILASTTCLAFMRTRSRPAGRIRSVLTRVEMMSGLRFIWGRPMLRAVLLVFGLGVNSAFGGMMFAGIVIASGSGRSGTGGGLVSSLASAGSLAGALLATRVDVGRHSRKLIVATCGALAAAAAILAVIQGPIVIGVATGLCMTVAAMASIGFNTQLLASTPKDRLGRVLSMAGLLSSLVQPLGPLVAGELLGVGGAALTYGALSIAFLACTLALVWLLARAAGPFPQSSAAEDVAVVAVS